MRKIIPLLSLLIIITATMSAKEVTVTPVFFTEPPMPPIVLPLYDITDKLKESPLYDDFKQLDQNPHYSMFLVGCFERNDSIMLYIGRTMEEEIPKYGDQVVGVAFMEGSSKPFFLAMSDFDPQAYLFGLFKRTNETATLKYRITPDEDADSVYWATYPVFLFLYSQGQWMPYKKNFYTYELLNPY